MPQRWRSADVGALLAWSLACVEASSTVFVPSFAKYPGYDGDLVVVGQMSIDTGTQMQNLRWSLTGLDTACTAGAGDNVANGCGIHIHTGTSCAAHADVGGHYWDDDDSNITDDPWAPVVYVAPSGASTQTDGVEVVTGLSEEDILGRVVVVHELNTGGRIACGVIGEGTGVGQALEVTDFVKYPGYAGDLIAAGSIAVTGVSGTASTAAQTLSWDLTGLDTTCVANAADDVKNGCGIHVHIGTSCAAHSGVGGHYYSDGISPDPWLPVVYVAASDGSSTEATGVAVVAGLSNADITGRVMVVHELATGTRIACGVIRRKTTPSGGGDDDEGGDDDDDSSGNGGDGGGTGGGNETGGNGTRGVTDASGASRAGVTFLSLVSAAGAAMWVLA